MIEFFIREPCDVADGGKYCTRGTNHHHGRHNRLIRKDDLQAALVESHEERTKSGRLLADAFTDALRRSP